MANKVEQLDRYVIGNCRAFIKKQTAKARRRAGKQDPENAGTRLRDYIKGYVS